MGSHGQTNGGINLGQLDNGLDVFLVTQSRPTVGFGHQDPQQTQCTHLAKEFPGEMLTFIPIHNVGTNIALSKFSNRFANQTGVI